MSPPDGQNHVFELRQPWFELRFSASSRQGGWEGENRFAAVKKRKTLRALDVRNP
jgi:hypothetical protein